MAHYTITTNEQYNSTEILFDEKPDVETREILKAMRFRWHSVKGVWYGYFTPDDVKKALEEGKPAAAGTAPKKSTPADVKNKYGVKVGDILTDSFGYNMTLVEFYKVTEILTPTTVKIQRIGATVDHTEMGGTEYLLPNPAHELEEPITKRVMPDKYRACGYHITIDSCISLTPWNGQPQYQNTWD